MKLYSLKAINEVPYDSFDSFVVRAESEEEARWYIQNSSNGDEKTTRIGNAYEAIPFWTDSQYSTCEEISEEGDTAIICSSYKAG